jgi:hypothetical protein
MSCVIVLNGQCTDMLHIFEVIIKAKGRIATEPVTLFVPRISSLETPEG